MENNFNYYYNNVPGKGLCRNNLIYTSLISNDKKVFCQWYHNDTDYHRGQNQVVDPSLMDEKWNRELTFLTVMNAKYPNMVPDIIDIDLNNKKIYLSIDGDDIWQRSIDNNNCPFDLVLPDWRTQMMDIFKAHHSLGIFKYSLHPSSYFIVDGKLKSINYFFCYTNDDKNISMNSVMSHISENRQEDLFPKMTALGIDPALPVAFSKIQLLAFESFKTNFPDDFMEEAKLLYV
jgi:hypothetical protein